MLSPTQTKPGRITGSLHLLETRGHILHLSSGENFLSDPPGNSSVGETWDLSVMDVKFLKLTHLIEIILAPHRNSHYSFHLGM